MGKQTSAECNCLTAQTLVYYGSDDPKKVAHLHRFTYETDHFNHMDLLAELEASWASPFADGGTLPS